MPLFSKTRKPKSEWKPRQPAGASIFDFKGFTSPQPAHCTSTSLLKQPVPTQNSPWQSASFSPPSCSVVHHSQPQMVPYDNTYAQAYTSSTHLPRQPSQPPLPRQPHEVHDRWRSCQNLSNTLGRPCQTANVAVNRTTDYLNRGAALCDQLASKFNDVISLMDEETFTGNEEDLRLIHLQSPLSSPSLAAAQAANHGGASKALVPARKRGATKVNDSSTSQKTFTTANVFAKAALYANSRLPADLPPLRIYITTWPLICRAAQYSLNAYRKPCGAEKDAYVEADWRVGTKAMVIKSVPLDEMNVVVFAIRGTQTFMDWAVNLNTATVSPSGFLDDPGNLCHAGFLDVARKMVKPVASRLRQMLEEDPGRAACSLVITGHSAGGAVASLLFSHMLSRTSRSELNILTGCFKRVHCVTFGAPPVSLLPLSKPTGQERNLRKNIFLSFLNEGDPVTRADKAYMRSLLELYGNPAPSAASRPLTGTNNALKRSSKGNVHSGFWNTKPNKGPKLPGRPATASATLDRPFSNVVWKVPPATLSNAGRLVLLRIPVKGGNEDVKALVATDEQLRDVVFGDPLMHQMKLYYRRVEILATKAATGRLLT